MTSRSACQDLRAKPCSQFFQASIQRFYRPVPPHYEVQSGVSGAESKRIQHPYTLGQPWGKVAGFHLSFGKSNSPQVSTQFGALLTLIHISGDLYSGQRNDSDNWISSLLPIALLKAIRKLKSSLQFHLNDWLQKTLRPQGRSRMGQRVISCGSW